MEIGMVRRIDIDAEMQQSYLDYAMSVIVARALPDARDGLKPVHRRILYAMHAMGIRPGSDYKKSARIVGEVLGKFHPHGDMAVYDAMARMAQSFSMRYALVDGQGNFGSIDGDPPAAMRYTEARLEPIAMEMLEDIEKDTVDFIDNFDGSLREPTVLPTALPNLLVNGSTGIAVGMATSIPPHNMGEVCDALTFLLENWSRLEKIGVEDLMTFIQGPDFPTGGIILRDKGDADGLTAAYGTGRGKVTLQARAHIEDMGRGRSRILVTELPFLTNKSALVERIAELARNGDLEGLADLRDESDRQGLRIVLELSKTATPEKVLAELYRRTPMQVSFGMTLLALVDGEPRLLTLKQTLRVFLEHRLEIVRRRSTYELTRARERAHILEGLRTALQHLDDVVHLIRTSADAEEAHARLRKRYKLSDVQTKAILDMPLRRLASLERKKIDQEHKETAARIKELEALLGSEKKMRDLLTEELARVKSTYGDRRRTLIVEARKGKGKKSALLTAGDLTPEKETWVVVTDDGLISRTPTARQPRLTGRSAPILLINAGGRDTLYLFEAGGSGAAIAVHTLPECDDPKDGMPVARATPYTEGQQVVAGVAVPPERSQLSPEACVVLGSFSGMIKKTPLEALPGPSAKPFSVMNIAEGDVLGWARVSRGHDQLLMVSSAGQAIRFDEQEVRPMGLAAGGVLGMKLEGGAGVRVVGMDCLRAEADLLLVRDDGQVKRVALSQFPVQGRYGKGVLAWKCTGGLHLAGAVLGQEDDRVAVHQSRGAAKSLRVGDAPRRTRGAAGKALIEVKDSDRVVRVTAGQPRPEVKAPPEPETAPRKVSSGKGKKAAKHVTRRTEKKPAAKKADRKSAAARPASKPAGERGKRAPMKGRGGH
jgi:DNA gyrase subunit A